jgi:hypothetical protein
MSGARHKGTKYFVCLELRKHSLWDCTNGITWPRRARPATWSTWLSGPAGYVRNQATKFQRTCLPVYARWRARLL